MRWRPICAAAVFATFLAVSGFSESVDCTIPVLIVADGRITQSTFPPNATLWYGIYAQAGHSYSVEFEPPMDNFPNSTKLQFAPLIVYGPNDTLQGCRGASSVGATQSSGYAPVLQKSGFGAGRRISFTAQNAGLYLIAVTNNYAGSDTYSFRAVDTTLFNLRWSTWAGYGDQWGFLNVSDMPVTGLLAVYDTNNVLISSVQFTVPALGEVFRSSYASDLNITSNRSGFAVFSYNGPPGSIIADAYMINSTGTVVTYTKFEGSAAH